MLFYKYLLFISKWFFLLLFFISFLFLITFGKETSWKNEPVIPGIEEMGGEEKGIQKNTYSGVFLPLTWNVIKKEYQEPDFSTNSPGDLIEIPCNNIRPNNFSRIHNLMVLSPFARCGFITVYQDKKKPDLSKIAHLFFIHLPSLSSTPRPDPLVFLTGGPGQPNTYLYSGMESIIDQFRYRQDYLLIDYRGTGLSIPTLNCLNYFKSTYKSEEDFFSTLKRCGENLKSYGVDLSLFNTKEIASDIHIALKVLGYHRADFHGVSYGSKVGLTLMRDHPEIVRSMVLDSVFPLEVESFGEADTILFNPLDNMIFTCKKSPHCQPKKLQQELIIFMKRILHLTSSQSSTSKTKINPTSKEFPAQIHYRKRLHTGAFNLIDAFRILSGREFKISQWPSELLFLNSLNNNDLISFFLNRLNIGTPPQEFIYQYFEDNLKEGLPLLALSLLTDFRGLWLSVTCQEESFISNIKRQLYPSRYFSHKWVQEVTKQLNQSIRDTGKKSCQSWGLSISSNSENYNPVKSNIPTLILNASIDPYTPLVWAESVKKNLSRSYLYVSETGGHDVAGTDYCALLQIIKFLENPTQYLKQVYKNPNQKSSNLCGLYQVPLRYEMK